MLEHAYRSTHIEARILEHRTGTAARGRRVTGGVGHCAAHRTGAAARGRQDGQPSLEHANGNGSADLEACCLFAVRLLFTCRLLGKVIVGRRAACTVRTAGTVAVVVAVAVVVTVAVAVAGGRCPPAPASRLFLLRVLPPAPAPASSYSPSFAESPPKHGYFKQICSCTLMDGLYSNSFRSRSVYRLCSGHGRGRSRRRSSEQTAPAHSMHPGQGHVVRT